MKVIKLRKKIQKLAFIKSSSGDERYFRSRLHKPKKYVLLSMYRVHGVPLFKDIFIKADQAF